MGKRKSPAIIRAAGRDRVVTRGRGLCLPSVLLPPSAPTSYHKKVTSVAKEQRGMRGFSFRESASPEAQCPGIPLLGSCLHSGNQKDGTTPLGVLTLEYMCNMLHTCCRNTAITLVHVLLSLSLIPQRTLVHVLLSLSLIPQRRALGS